jgi:DNA-binding SARP family transcriptional activator
MLHRLALFGPVCLTGSARPSLRRASQQRRIALLSVIASSPTATVSRDRLIGLLWPDRDERIARQRLSDSLYVLRQTLGDGAIVVSTDAVRLSPEFVWTDVAEFRRAVTGEHWSDALELYRGDFLDGFYVRNATDFDQWAHTERARLRTLATRCASTLANVLARTGRIAEAAAVAERALEISPCDEAVLRDVVRLLIAAENRARAEVVARAFVERLALEIGVAPSAETMRLVQEARAMTKTEPIVVVATGTLRRQRREVDSMTATIIAQGRHHWNQRTRVSVERAISYFTRATERDARATGAWCGLADCWVTMGGRGYAPPVDAIERARVSAERALALDDTLSAAQTSLGGVHLLRRRWRDAESSFRRAILLDSRNADAHHWLSLALLSGFGVQDEAVRAQTIAARLNPVSPMQIGSLGWQQYLSGDYDLSRSSMESTVDLNAELEESHAGLARVAARLGDEATVNATISAGITKRCDLRGDLLAEQASAFAVLGDAHRARRLVREACSRGAMPMNLALAWASLGDADRAFRCLAGESFLVSRAPQTVWWDPRFDGLRDDARFVRVRESVAQAWKPEWW